MAEDKKEWEWLFPLINRKYEELNPVYKNGIEFRSFALGVIAGFSLVVDGEVPHIEINATTKRLKRLIAENR